MSPIYDQKSRIKILVAALALLIGAATIIYTNWLVQRVSEREQQQIQLYAKAQEFIINAESESSTFVVNEIVNANVTIPVILSSDGKDIIAAKNIVMPAHLSAADSVTLLGSELRLMLDGTVPGYESYEDAVARQPRGALAARHVRRRVRGLLGARAAAAAARHACRTTSLACATALDAQQGRGVLVAKTVRHQFGVIGE